MIQEIKGLGSFSHIHFTLQQKNIKSIILKIKDKNHIHISSPYGVGLDKIIEVVERRKEWIEKRVEQFLDEKKEQICNGGWVYHLGDMQKIFYFPASQAKVESENGEIRVYAKEEGQIGELIYKWQKREAQRVYAELLAVWEERMGVKSTHLSIKKMTSRWGSCNPKKGYINLNFFLIKMPREAIEYVVVHELIHFFFYYHNKDFYAMMSKYLPQWEQREALLKEWRRRVSSD